jgi:hypothetical protein
MYAACTTNDCSTQCETQFLAHDWAAYIAAVEVLSVCPCASCEAQCGDSCSIAADVRTSPRAPDCSPCREAGGYDPVCAGRACITIGDATQGLATNECTRPCASDADCAATHACAVDSRVCVPRSGRRECSSDRRAVLSYDTCNVVYDRAACASNAECDPATTACRAVGSGGFCTRCASNLDCASRVCNAGTCSRSCTRDTDCPSGFHCSGSVCVGSNHNECSADWNRVVTLNACGVEVATVETCTGSLLCDHLSSGAPYCGSACANANAHSHFGTGHCTYTNFNRSTGQCCGMCIDYSDPEFGPTTWSSCVAAR